MSRLVWDQTGEKFYETGVSNVALYPQDDKGVYPKGVAWNGITAINESPSGAEATPLYADNIKYLELRSAEEYGSSIEAYTYPDEFAECDGSAEIAQGVKIGQQPRKPFGLVYKTTMGNDVQENDYGYKLHVIYGAKAAPSEKAYATINDSPEAITFALDYAFDKSISGTVIVEEFVDKVGCSSDTDSFLLNGELKFVSFNAQHFDENAANPYTPAAYSWPSTFIEHEEYLKTELQRLLTLLNMQTSVFNPEGH